jgi:hypothetical protein
MSETVVQEQTPIEASAAALVAKGITADEAQQIVDAIRRQTPAAPCVNDWYQNQQQPVGPRGHGALFEARKLANLLPVLHWQLNQIERATKGKPLNDAAVCRAMGVLGDVVAKVQFVLRECDPSHPLDLGIPRMKEIVAEMTAAPPAKRR